MRNSVWLQQHDTSARGAGGLNQGHDKLCKRIGDHGAIVCIIFETKTGKNSRIEQDFRRYSRVFQRLAITPRSFALFLGQDMDGAGLVLA